MKSIQYCRIKRVDGVKVLHQGKIKELSIRLKAMKEAKETLSQIIAIGEKYKGFTGANFNSRLAKYAPDVVEEYSGVIFIKDQPSISSGFCKSVGEVFASLEKGLQELAPAQLEMVAA